MIVADYRAGVSASLLTSEEVAQLRADNERLAAECEHYRELYLRTLEQCRKLELGLLGQKAERLSPNDAQLTMQVLTTLLGPRVDNTAPTPPVNEQRIREHTRTKPSGRKPLPDRLPARPVLPSAELARPSRPGLGTRVLATNSRASRRPAATRREHLPARQAVAQLSRSLTTRR